MNFNFINILGASNLKSFRRLKVYIINAFNKFMKLQKRFLRKHKNKDYYKYIVNIPPMMVKEAGLKEGEELQINAKNGRLTIKKKRKNERI